MTEILVIRREEVESLLDRGALQDGLAGALADLSSGNASVPPRIAAFAPRGLLGAMPGYLPGVGMAIKVITIFAENHDRGLPSHLGVILLFDEDTGEAIAMMDATSITRIRTAGAAALAAGLLARRGARSLAIVGAGAQGATHLESFAHLRAWSDIRITSRDLDRAAAVARRDDRARVVPGTREAVEGCDVVCLCTHTSAPLIELAWLAPGAHVSSVGSGTEIDAATIAAGTVFVEWRGAATNPPPAVAFELQGVEGASLTEIGEVVAGTRPGRRSDDELTVYKSTGHAVEDVVAARLVYDAAVAAGIGTITVV